MSRYYEDFEVGQKLPTYSRTLTEADLSWFCAFVGYHVPLFIDEEYAKKTRYGGRIIPSGMIMSISTGMTELSVSNQCPRTARGRTRPVSCTRPDR